MGRTGQTGISTARGETEMSPVGHTRRAFIRGLALAAGGATLSLAAACGPAAQPAAPAQAPPPTQPPPPTKPAAAAAPTTAPAAQPTTAPAATAAAKPGTVVQIGRRSEINPLWNPLKTAGGEVQ